MHQVGPRYAIDRPAYSQPDFDEEFNRKRRNYPLGDKVRNVFRYVTTAEWFVEVKFGSVNISGCNKLCNFIYFNVFLNDADVPVGDWRVFSLDICQCSAGFPNTISGRTFCVMSSAESVQAQFRFHRVCVMS